MIVVLGFYKRHPDLSWEEFSDHWRNVHGALLRDTPEPRKAIRRYVQHHLRPNPGFPGESLPFDGFSESWYDSVESRQELWALPLWRDLVIPDEQTFLDTAATRVSVLDSQYTVIGDPITIGGEVVSFF
ncbi:EthD domain-containing protein [Rhodococcus jostii]|uniref:EthD domain-containing protein n=1 Tax=Rhodococcus jostii TaxID=132919 RepID=A0A1H4IX80_RHOJO|nr:EthD domain-containing protein [Rhodococcus jostii]SEB38690.1 EthD domain-containing protein [Rhodococcus jostii]